MNEIDAVVKILSKDLLEIYQKNKKNNKIMLGKLGEHFVRTGIKQVFFNKGYKIARRGTLSFHINTHYGTKIYEGGVDFYLKFSPSRLRVCRCFIEVKNWKHMKKGISDDIFEKEILGRFRKKDVFRLRHWILIINKFNVQYIGKRCEENGIRIVPIDGHLTQQYVYPLTLKPIFEKFVEDFSHLIDDILKKNNLSRYSIVSHPDQRLSKKDLIEKDLLQGKDYRVIAKKYNTSTQYVQKIKSNLNKMRKRLFGKPLPDRREKNWKTMQLITQNKDNRM